MSARILYTPTHLPWRAATAAPCLVPFVRGSGCIPRRGTFARPLPVPHSKRRYSKEGGAGKGGRGHALPERVADRSRATPSGGLRVEGGGDGEALGPVAGGQRPPLLFCLRALSMRPRRPAADGTRYGCCVAPPPDAPPGCRPIRGRPPHPSAPLPSQPAPWGVTHQGCRRRSVNAHLPAAGGRDGKAGCAEGGQRRGGDDRRQPEQRCLQQASTCENKASTAGTRPRSLWNGRS